MKLLVRIILLAGVIFVLPDYTVIASNSVKHTVIVDGKKNCLLLDKALTIEAGAGHHHLTTIPGYLPYVIRGKKRVPYAFVRGWDHSAKKVGYGLVFFGKSINKYQYGSAISKMTQKAGPRGMRFHVFFVDDYINDNGGSIGFTLDNGKYFSVDSSKHVLDLKAARKVKLDSGMWNVTTVTGSGYKGIHLSGPKSTPRTRVLLRSNRQISSFDLYAVVTKFGLWDPVKMRYFKLLATRGAVVYVFCVDDYIADNSGAVKVVFLKTRI